MSKGGGARSGQGIEVKIEDRGQDRGQGGRGQDRGVEVKTEDRGQDRSECLSSRSRQYLKSLLILGCRYH